MKKILPLIAMILGVALPASASELCIVPSSNGVNAYTPCAGAETQNTDWLGFSTVSSPCGPGLYICYVEAPAVDYLAWTISDSPVDPLATTGTIGPGTTDLYLWLFCSYNGLGLASAEFGLGGDLAVHSFTPLNGVLNAGTDTDLRLAIGGCPSGPVAVGRITVGSAVGVEGNVESADWGTRQERVPLSRSA